MKEEDQPDRTMVSPDTTGRWMWLIIALVVVSRLLAPLVPGMWLWGFNTLRFLPWWGWALTATAALFLIPWVGRRVERSLDRWAARIEPPTIGYWLVIAAAGTIVFLLPDRVFFVGDFLIRQSSAEIGAPPSILYPQALPLDLALHYQLPAWARQNFGVDPNLTNRFVGAVNGALLALLSIAFARRMAARGATLVAVSSVFWFGGWLLLFTGYAKALSAMPWIILTAAILGLDILRGRRSYFWYALFAAAALWLHRSALGLLPAAAFLALAARGAQSAPASVRQRGKLARGRDPNREPARSVQWSWGLGLLVLLGSIAVITPRLVSTIVAWDAAHFSLSHTGSGGFLSLISPPRLLDNINLFLFLVPLAPLALLLFRRPWSTEVLTPREGWFLLTLLAPYLLLVVSMHPAQGVFRDIDSLAMGGMTVAIAVAVVVASVLKRDQAAAWLAIAVAVGSAVPTLHSLLLNTDLERGLARVDALAQGPPERSIEIRVHALDFIAARLQREGDYAGSTIYLKTAVDLAPSPRLVSGWALAASKAGDWEQAESAYALLLERAPEDLPRFRLLALMGLASASGRRGDLDAAHRYLEEVLAMDPNHGDALRLMQQVELEKRARADAPPSPGP